MIRRRKKAKVFVAMSGGVDSSVAAALLKKAGYDVVGVTMCFNIKRPEGKRPSCCGIDGIEDAKRAAQILGIPHYVFNFGNELDKYIIQDFIQEYTKGRTPNPCVRCNQFIKFDSLLKKVRGLGAEYLATGHYAKVQYSRRKRKYILKKGKDKTKEQSYFLYGIKKDILPLILFPLGNLTKTQVRRLAKKFGLVNADKPGSQDICFIPDEGYQKFLKSHLPKDKIKLGPIKNKKDEILGEHQGIMKYTIGQRDGLGVALGKPAYVYRIDEKTNTIYVGDNSQLFCKAFLARRLNFLSIDPPRKKKKTCIKIRYNQTAVEANVQCSEDVCAKVEFKKPQRAVTPGQSVVFYDGDVVLGGGIIEKSLD